MSRPCYDFDSIDDVGGCNNNNKKSTKASSTINKFISNPLERQDSCSAMYFQTDLIDQEEAQQISRLYGVISKLSFWKINKRSSKQQKPHSSSPQQGQHPKRNLAAAAQSPAHQNATPYLNTNGTFPHLTKTFSSATDSTTVCGNLSFSGAPEFPCYADTMNSSSGRAGEPLVSSSLNWFEGDDYDDDVVLLPSDSGMDDHPWRFDDEAVGCHSHLDKQVPEQDEEDPHEDNGDITAYDVEELMKELEFFTDEQNKQYGFSRGDDVISLATLREDLSVWILVRERLKRLFRIRAEARTTRPSSDPFRGSNEKENNRLSIEEASLLACASLSSQSINGPSRTIKSSVNRFNNEERLLCSPLIKSNSSHNIIPETGSTKVAEWAPFADHFDSFKEKQRESKKQLLADRIDFADLNALDTTQSLLTEISTVLSVATDPTRENCAQLVLRKCEDDEPITNPYEDSGGSTVSSSAADPLSCTKNDTRLHNDLVVLGANDRLHELVLGAAFPFSSDFAGTQKMSSNLTRINNGARWSTPPHHHGPPPTFIGPVVLDGPTRTTQQESFRRIPERNAAGTLRQKSDKRCCSTKPRTESETKTARAQRIVAATETLNDDMESRTTTTVTSRGSFQFGGVQGIENAVKDMWEAQSKDSSTPCSADSMRPQLFMEQQSSNGRFHSANDPLFRTILDAGTPSFRRGNAKERVEQQSMATKRGIERGQVSEDTEETIHPTSDDRNRVKCQSPLFDDSTYTFAAVESASYDMRSMLYQGDTIAHYGGSHPTSPCRSPKQPGHHRYHSH